MDDLFVLCDLPPKFVPVNHSASVHVPVREFDPLVPN